MPSGRRTIRNPVNPHLNLVNNMHVIKMVGSLFLLFCPGGPALAQSNIAIPADLLHQFSGVGATGAAVKLWLFITVIILLATAIINLLCWIYIFIRELVWTSSTWIATRAANENTKKFAKDIFPAFLFAIFGSLIVCFVIVLVLGKDVITRDQFMAMVEKGDTAGVRRALEQVGMDDMPSGKDLLMQMQAGQQE